MNSIKQLSVFLENKSGRLNEILEILGNEDIKIIASSVADTSEFGILRMITSDTPRAVEVLKGSKVSANISNVIAIKCSNTASSYAMELAKLALHDIHIEYMYSYSCGESSTLILRTNDNDKAVEFALKNNMILLKNSDL